MRRLFFLMLALLGFAMSGCGQVDWFPDATSGGSVTVAAFSFTPLTDVKAGEVQTSNTITVSLTGGTTAPISVTNGEYQIGTGTFTSTAGTVKSGDKVTVHHTAASTPSTTVTTTLTIGKQSATFSSTTAPVTATAFSFSPPGIAGVTAGEAKSSNTITVALTGGTSAPISVTGGGKYMIARVGTATSEAGTVNNGDVVSVVNTIPAGTTGTIATTLTIADKSATFTTTTGNVVPQTVTVTGSASNPITGQVVLNLKPGTYTVAFDSSTTTSGGYTLKKVEADAGEYGQSTQTVGIVDGQIIYFSDLLPEGVTTGTTIVKVDGVPITFIAKAQ